MKHQLFFTGLLVCSFAVHAEDEDSKKKPSTPTVSDTNNQTTPVTPSTTSGTTSQVTPSTDTQSTPVTNTASGNSSTTTDSTTSGTTPQTTVSEDKTSSTTTASTESGNQKTSETTVNKDTSTATKFSSLNVFGIDKNGNAIDVSGTTFAGGISIDGGQNFIDATKTVVGLKKGSSIQISGNITPSSTHKGKSADLIVVGLYSKDLTDESCTLKESAKNSGQQAYYMVVGQGSPEFYCKWNNTWNAANGECKDGQKFTRSKSSATDYYQEWQQWDASLTNLQASKSITSLDEMKEIALYVDKGISHAGFICVNFGYRLQDGTGTLIFNAEPLKFKVSE
ncbi:MAG: hypothetical protein RL368_403 [Pseudomonadota bacterium]|jgi:hypothetical protein